MSPHSLTPPHPIIFTIIIIIILWSSYIRYVARKQTGWDSSADEERGDRPPSFFRLNIRHAKCHSANGHTFFGLLLMVGGSGRMCMSVPPCGTLQICVNLNRFIWPLNGGREREREWEGVVSLNSWGSGRGVTYIVLRRKAKSNAYECGPGGINIILN